MEPASHWAELNQILTNIQTGIQQERAQTQAAIATLTQVVQALTQEVTDLRDKRLTGPETIGTKEAAAIWRKSPGYLRECLNKKRDNLPEQWIEGLHFWKEPGHNQWNFSRSQLLDWDRNRANLAITPANLIAHRRRLEKHRQIG